MGVSVCLSVCVVCVQILVFKYDQMVHKTCHLQLQAKRHVVYVVVM